MKTRQPTLGAGQADVTKSMMIGIRHALASQVAAICAALMALNPLSAWADEPVNVNLASAEVLADALEGVGLAKACRIMEYREAHGPVEPGDELAAVPGFGLATVEKNRDVFDCNNLERSRLPCCW